MEQAPYQKIVNIAYLALAVLVAFVSLTGLVRLTSLYDLESKIKSIDLVIRIFSVVLGGVVFLILYSNQKSNDYMNEVAAELFTKVSWPTTKDTSAATVVVMVSVLIAGIVLAVLDWLFTLGFSSLWNSADKLLKWIF